MGLDMLIIDYILWQEDIDEILKIPLGDLRSRDIRTWHHSTHERYTVQSAYRLVMARRDIVEQAVHVQLAAHPLYSGT